MQSKEINLYQVVNSELPPPPPKWYKVEFSKHNSNWNDDKYRFCCIYLNAIIVPEIFYVKTVYTENLYEVVIEANLPEFIEVLKKEHIVLEIEKPEMSELEKNHLRAVEALKRK